MFILSLSCLSSLQILRVKKKLLCDSLVVCFGYIFLKENLKIINCP